MAEGRVWGLTVPPDAVTPLRERHLVSRMVRTGAGVWVRVLAPAAPAPGATPAPLDLEDAYLTITHDPAGAAHTAERPR
jgi:ABC-2 type transport system ATP-binding protein